MSAPTVDKATEPPMGFVDEIFDRPGSVRALALLRIALAPVVLVHLAPFLAAAARGDDYRDHFFEPWWPVAPVVPGGAQTGLVVVGAIAAVAMGLGWRARWTAPVTLACVAANFFVSQTHFRHNRAFLLFLLLGVSLGNSGAVLSVDARRRRRAGRPVDDRDTIWPIWVLRALVVSAYLGSGVSKLIDPDWRSGLVLWDRTVRFQSFVRDGPLPFGLGDPVADLVTQRWVHSITSPIAIAIELFVAGGLWFGRTRLAAVWIALFFHLSIELSASVEVFSLAAIVALAIWATPSTRDRSIECSDGRWIRRLDWLARFQIVERPGQALRVTDRDGRVHEGRSATWLVLSRLPVSFFPSLPVRRWMR